MYRKAVTVTVILMLAINLSAQEKQQLILKTRPLRFAVAYNPNIAMEYQLWNRFTLEAEGLWKNRAWYSSGGEWNFGKYHHSNGYRALLGARYYLGSAKERKVPFAMYLGFQYAYSYTSMEAIAHQGFPGGYENTKDVEKMRSEMFFVFGRQIQMFGSDFLLDINIGLRYKLNWYDKFTIVESIDKAEIGETETRSGYYTDRLLPMVGFSVGYLFR